jgi:hypothetical protein
VNDDGAIDLSDGIFGLSFLFAGGPPPPEPFSRCGSDGRADSLSCESYPPCCLSQAVDVTAVSVKNPQGQPPGKGDALVVTITLKNSAAHDGRVRVTPRLQSRRFTEFIDVPLGTVEAELGPGEIKEVTVTGGPFIGDPIKKKEYAIGSGSYAISGVTLECAGGTAIKDALYTGKDFIVATSNAIFTAVVYDAGYLTKIHYTAGAEQYMIRSFTRRCEVFTPDAPGSSTGTYRSFAGGFDEMLAIHQLFRVFPGFSASSAAGGFCEQADAYAHQVLGLTRDWDIGAQATDPAHHGFDILVGLTPAFGGGATCGWLGTQISGLFDFDLSLNRSEIIVVHEMGHIFGAPHCDPLQGYVMCAGEKHPHYIQSGIFVWHQESLDAMANPYH